MDILGLIELMQDTEPGTVLDAQIMRDSDGANIEFKIDRINGQKIEEA